MSNEIACTACGQTALVRREPRYERFRKTGETIVCTACGHRYGDGEPVPWCDKARGPALFTDADKPAAVRVFGQDERGRCCRYCVHYVVNPFTQRCDLHRRAVVATDLCADFEAAPAASKEEEEA
jgi:hypothetical protein